MYRRWSARPATLVYPFLLLLIVVGVYHVWFLVPGLITSGDQPFYSLDRLKDSFPFPSLWDSTSLTGAYSVIVAPFFPVYSLQGLLAFLGVGWAISGRLLWLWPAVVIPCVSTYVLALSLFRQARAAFIAALFVVMNSYVYLIYEGGQPGVAVGYGFMPLVLWAFLRGQRRGRFNGFVLTGAIMSIQAMYDIRSTYISLGILFVYGLFRLAGTFARKSAFSAATILHALGLPHLLTALLVLGIIHLWWILPALFVHGPTLPPGYADVASVHPLSQANVSNALALFQPFWFANDAHVYPINPLFFITPLIIFSLLRRRHDMLVLFLAAIALIAAFFVKGDNEPAGMVYDWLFVHLPGFSLFRDPSKFYQPLALAYALLLGIAALEWQAVRKRATHLPCLNGPLATAIPFVIVAVFPAYPALFQQVRGAFAINPLPADYVRLNAMIDQQPSFFRVLWVPARPRFGTFSARHPALDAAQLAACCIKTVGLPPQPWSWLALPSALQILRELSVRYIVVPGETQDSDFTGLPWITRGIGMAPAAVLSALRTFLPGLRQFQIGRLRVFVVRSSYPLLFVAPANSPAHVQRSGCALGALNVSDLCVAPGIKAAPAPASITAMSVSESWFEFRVRVTRAPIHLVLQQTYDRNWLAFVQAGNRPLSRLAMLTQRPLPPDSHLVANRYANAWLIQTPGTYRVVLEFWPQRLVLLGWLLTAIVALAYGSFMLLSRLHRYTGQPYAR